MVPVMASSGFHYLSENRNPEKVDVRSGGGGGAGAGGWSFALS